MKLAILTVTEGGKKQALKLRKKISYSGIYVMPQFYEDEDNIIPIQSSLQEAVKNIFYKVDALLFIMATGIVVRTIAPFIQDKKQDPAVVVMDEMGKNIISLLSGHLGGANDLTMEIARIVGGNPVITTASDIKGKLAVDVLAQRLKCKIKDWQLTKKITAHIVKGEEVAIYSDKPLPELPKEYIQVKDLKEILNYSYGIYIGNRYIEGNNKQLLQLYTTDLVIGIGCKKDIAYPVVMEAIKTSLNKVGKTIDSVKKMVTIDLKANEAALIKAAKVLNVPLEILSRKKLLEIEDRFETSNFVKETIGVGAVSEPCAYLGSKEGKMLLIKLRYGGVTISLAEEGDE